MAQTGYTPILIYSSSTAAAAPAAGSLTNSTLGSELAINITDGKLFYKDNANAIQVIGWKTVPTTAGGTGLTSYTAGDLVYYATGTTFTKLAIGASGNYLSSSGTAPQWSAPAALTKTNDTNVTLTLGGSASTALLNAASLTLGWTGTLAVSRGGTGTGTAGITAFNNITGYTASGATGTTSTNLVFSTSPSLTTPRVITSINDTNGNELIAVTATASAVNEFTVTNAATGNAPALSATGGDTNINISITPKGTGDTNLTTGKINVYGDAIIGQNQITADSTVGTLGIYGGLAGGTTNARVSFFGKSVSNTGQTYEIARIVGASYSGPGYSLDGGLGFSVASNNGSNVLTLAEQFRINSTGKVFFPGAGTTASAANAFLNNGSTPANELLRSTSSIRYKTDVENLDPLKADAILNFRPVWYRSLAKADRKDWSWYGLIAEEVAEIEPRLVHWSYLESDYDIIETNIEKERVVIEDGVEKIEPYTETTVEKKLKKDAKLVPDSVQYDRLTVMLLDVIKRQDKRIENLENKILALESK